MIQYRSPSKNSIKVSHGNRNFETSTVIGTHSGLCTISCSTPLVGFKKLCTFFHKPQTNLKAITFYNNYHYKLQLTCTCNTCTSRLVSCSYMMVVTILLSKYRNFHIFLDSICKKTYAHC